jgi:hypothetical protein
MGSGCGCRWRGDDNRLIKFQKNENHNGLQSRPRRIHLNYRTKLNEQGFIDEKTEEIKKSFGGLTSTPSEKRFLMNLFKSG